MPRHNKIKPGRPTTITLGDKGTLVNDMKNNNKGNALKKMAYHQ